MAPASGPLSRLRTLQLLGFQLSACHPANCPPNCTSEFTNCCTVTRAKEQDGRARNTAVAEHINNSSTHRSGSYSPPSPAGLSRDIYNPSAHIIISDCLSWLAIPSCPYTFKDPRIANRESTFSPSTFLVDVAPRHHARLAIAPRRPKSLPIHIRLRLSIRSKYLPSQLGHLTNPPLASLPTDYTQEAGFTIAHKPSWRRVGALQRRRRSWSRSRSRSKDWSHSSSTSP